MNIINQRSSAPAVDPSVVSGACRGFEGLIINRGRPSKRNPAVAPIAHQLNGVPRSIARSTALHIGIADSLDQIEAANRLVCHRYAWRGYSLDALHIQGQFGTGCQSRHEIMFLAAEPPTTHGTLTLRLDGPEGLRAEATHPETMCDARARGGRIGELTRLAVAEGVDSRGVLASLFGLVYAVGRTVHGVTDAFIEVNPRHVAFYSRALGFTVASEARLCERVGAPSVLLHLDVQMLDEQLGVAVKNAA